MARVIVHEEDGPLYVDEDDIHPEKGDIAICQCGLSDERPFCDGSHDRTAGEDPAELYAYDGTDRERVDIEPRDDAPE
ncbi:MAG: CDGSH iron-sulfur domain-containing protein [Halobaculum sp.]|jgi:CDGSH-type Zn-finger protein